MRPPHRFPFELVDRVADGAARAGVSAGCWWLRGDRPLSLPWLVEATAQAAARLLEPAAERPRRLALAAIDGATMKRPARAGERLELRVRLAGRLGALVRVEGEIDGDEPDLGRVSLTLGASEG